MPTFRCLFCQHANPNDAKFCNECGSGLRLQPCAHCDAINDRDAAHCHHCGVALAPRESTADAALNVASASQADAVPTLVDEVTLPASAVRAEHRTSVDRAFEVLERDLATLDRFRSTGRAGAAAPWSLAARNGAAAGVTDVARDLATVRLQPFWRVRVSRPLARSVTTMATAGVALAVAVAGYLHTLPPGKTEGVLVTAFGQAAPESVGAPSVDVAAPRPQAPSTAPQVVASTEAPPAFAAPSNAAAPADAAKGDPLPSPPADVAKADPLPSPSAAVAKIDAPPPADVANAVDPLPVDAADGGIESPTQPAPVTKAASPVTVSEAPRATTKSRRARTSAARSFPPQVFDGAPVNSPGVSAAAVVAPAAGPCTAGVAALGLCTREPDASRR